MTALFEFCLQPDSYDLIRQLVAELVCRETQDIGVVVESAVFGCDTVVAGCCADTAELVRRDAHSDPGTTDQNASIDLTAGNAASNERCIIRIIDALRFIWTVVDRFRNALHGFQQLEQTSFQLETSVVACDSDFHFNQRSFSNSSSIHSVRFS